jgi:hypothetical protein
MYLRKYAHRNLLEVEKMKPIFKKILEDHLYPNSHHKTPETIPPTINKQSHEINIKSKLLKHAFGLHIDATKSRTTKSIPFHY